jgi:hypothetical protein
MVQTADPGVAIGVAVVHPEASDAHHPTARLTTRMHTPRMPMSNMEEDRKRCGEHIVSFLLDAVADASEQPPKPLVARSLGRTWNEWKTFP